MGGGTICGNTCLYSDSGGFGDTEGVSRSSRPGLGKRLRRRCALHVWLSGGLSLSHRSQESRASIDTIKKHPWFNKPLPERYANSLQVGSWTLGGGWCVAGV